MLESLDTLDEILHRQNRIIASRPLEANSELNDSNRELIAKYAESKGAAFLGRINSVAGFGKEILAVYNGQIIYNFEYDVCIPSFDMFLLDLITEWRKNPRLRTLNQIHDRINSLGGLLLIWS